MSRPKTTAGDGSLGRAGVFLASGTVVSRILGFVAAIILARTLGTIGSGADSFALANQLPNNIYALVAGGILTAILVPHIVKATSHADGGQAFINKIVTIGLLLFLAIAVTATLLAPFLVSLYAQEGVAGGRGFSADDIALATALAYWCLPQVLFYALYSLLSEVLNARKVYGPFTWAPVVNNIILITGLLVFAGVFHRVDTSDALAWTPAMVGLLGASATTGVAGQALVLFLFWKRAGLSFRPDFQWRGVGLAATGRAATWMFGMILVTQIAGIFQSNVASLATADGDAGLAILRFSWLIFMLPHSVITVSLATAYFTNMSHRATEGNLGALADTFVDAVRRIGMFMVLAAVGLIVVAGPFARVFSAADKSIDQMTLVIVGYALGLLPFTVVFVLQRVFFSLNDTRTPFVLQVVNATVFITLVLTVAGFPSNRIALGIAVSTSAAATLQLLVGLVILRRRLRGIRLRRILPAFGVFFFAAFLAALAGVGTLLLFRGGAEVSLGSQGAFGAGVSIVIIVVVMTSVYAGVLALMRNREFLDVVSGSGTLLRRIFRRGE
jgi:putative peptidoglycan lipid II flippase